MDKINHYSLENPASVYDEEALTALELAARTAAKVNGCVDAVNDFRERFLDNVDKTVAEYINRLIVEGEINVDGLRPSGDPATDVRNIDALLTAFGVAKLGEGVFTLNYGLGLGSGVGIVGAGTAKTKIVFTGYGFANVGADHLRVEDLTVEAPNTAFSLKGTTTEPFTGVRYATFRNVDIIAGKTGVELRGAWCVKFDHCRWFIEGGQTGVKQDGTCNNVVYDHCQFIGLTDTAACGVQITADDGAQNCGISFRDCSFEKLQIGVRAYCVMGLNVSSIYAEGVGTLFSVDSCPNFNVNGGYAVYIGRLCSVYVTNTHELFAHSGGKISNVFCSLKSGNGNYLINARDPRTYNLTVEQVTAKWADDGSGDIYYFDRDLNQAYGAACHYPVGYWTADLNDGINADAAVSTVTKTDEETLKLLGLELVSKSTYTPTAGTIRVLFNDVEVYTFNINAVEYAAGQVVSGTPIIENLRFTDFTRGEMTVKTSNSKEAGAWKFRAKMCKGKMIANKEVQ